MKLLYKVSALFLVSILSFGYAFAQKMDTTQITGNSFRLFSKDGLFRTWSVGVNTGILTYTNVLDRNKNLDFTSPSSKIGYGVYVKKQILPILGIQGQLFSGSLNAANSQQTTNGDPDYLSSSSKLNYAGSINFVFSFANLNWHYNNAGVQPFISAGFGLMNYHPKLTTVDITGTVFTTTDQGSFSASYVPVQIGLKLNASSNLNVELGYQLNLAMKDNVDGNVYGSNNDRFSYFNAGLEFALGKRSKPQMATYSTVPERHPRVIVKKAKNKVPIAKTDSVKTQVAVVQPNNNQINDRLKLLSMDSDSDGVSDYFDKCPNTPKGTVVDNQGCPILEVNGKAQALISEKEKQIIADASKYFEFSNAKASFNRPDPILLDEFMRVLIENRMDTNFPAHVLIISGYTNELESDINNQTLSNQRAEAVKNYLVSRGIKSANIITVGYGNVTPAGANAGTTHGRKIVFTLF